MIDGEHTCSLIERMGTELKPDARDCYASPIQSLKLVGRRDQRGDSVEMAYHPIQTSNASLWRRRPIFQTPSMPKRKVQANIYISDLLHNEPLQRSQSSCSFALKGHDHSLALKLELLFGLAGIIVDPFLN